MNMNDEQPIVNVQGGFLRSLENNVAVIRALGFDTRIKIFRSSSKHYHAPLTLLIENVQGEELEIEHHNGHVRNVLRSKGSLMCDVVGPNIQTIHCCHPHQTEEFDFMFFGDVHGMFHHLHEIIQSANELDPLFLMSNGDMTHGGRLEDYHILTDVLSRSAVPVFSSIGNHDKRARGGRTAYRRLLAPFYYSFSLGKTTFIVLDSSRKRGLQRFQYKWLEQELQLAKGQRILVFLHRPPVCPKYNYLAFSASSNAWRFLSLMEQYNVEAVFGSHVHVFSEFYKRGVRYVISGGGGGALWQPANFHHYLHVFIKKGGVDVQTIKLPTPDAKVSQRLKDVIKFNVEHHIMKNRHFRQATVLGTALLLSRSTSSRRFRLRRRRP
ncbi:MAG: hypothetical protein GY801_42255 [bacterium]|nr:hypothetical protein [bacterium]